jgi:hypothetical protein
MQHNPKVSKMSYKVNAISEYSQGLEFLTYLSIRKIRRKNDKVNRRYYSNGLSNELKRLLEEGYDID